jgi:FSR family fosmidomycin resistance protein-like MFS transporter
VTALPVPLLPFIRNEFNLDYTRAGFVISAFTLSYGASHLPGGWLADRLGPRIMITIGICGVAAFGILTGISPTYITLIVFLVLMGLAGGGYHTSATPLISKFVAPQKLGRAFGFHIIGGSASYFLAPIIAAGIAASLGWRGTFIGLAVPAILYGIIFYVLLGRVAATKKAEPTKITRQSGTAPVPSDKRHLVSFIILSTFTQAVLIAVISFIPLYLVDHFGGSKETAAASLALIYSAGLWVSPLGGYLSDRVGSISMILAACFIAGPVIFLLSLAPYGLGTSAVLVIMGIIMFIRMPVSEVYIVNHTSERKRSTVLGIYFFGTIEGGGVLTPVAGYLIDKLGFHSTFTIAGAAVLAVTVASAIALRGSRG